MTHSKGYRSGTRYKFSKGYRQRGAPNQSRLQAVYHRGDYVTIKGDGSVHKGMPHSFYHGRTGRVYDVTPSSLGVKITKRVGNRVLLKLIHVRREHVKKSRCFEDFVKRKTENDRIHRDRCAAGIKTPISLKRLPKGPEESKFVESPTIVDITPIPFVEYF